MLRCPHTVCGHVNDNKTALVLNATSGFQFQGVMFASYGQPTGSCGNYFTGLCHAANSQTYVSSLCLGQRTCTIPATYNAVLGDPCPTGAKYMYVQLSVIYVGTSSKCDRPVIDSKQCSVSLSRLDF